MLPLTTIPFSPAAVSSILWTNTGSPAEDVAVAPISGPASFPFGEEPSESLSLQPLTPLGDLDNQLDLCSESATS